MCIKKRRFPNIKTIQYNTPKSVIIFGLCKITRFTFKKQIELLYAPMQFAYECVMGIE